MSRGVCRVARQRVLVCMSRHTRGAACGRHRTRAASVTRHRHVRGVCCPAQRATRVCGAHPAAAQSRRVLRGVQTRWRVFQNVHVRALSAAHGREVLYGARVSLCTRVSCVCVAWRMRAVCVWAMPTIARPRLAPQGRAEVGPRPHGAPRAAFRLRLVQAEPARPASSPPTPGAEGAAAVQRGLSPPGDFPIPRPRAPWTRGGCGHAGPRRKARHARHRKVRPTQRMETRVALRGRCPSRAVGSAAGCVAPVPVKRA